MAFAHLAAEPANSAVFGDIDYFDELRPGNLKSSARRGVLRVAGNPYRVALMPTDQRHQQCDRARGVVVAAMGWMHVIADVPGVAFNVRSGANAQVDVSQFLLGMLAEHSERIDGHTVERVNKEIGESQFEVTLTQ